MDVNKLFVEAQRTFLNKDYKESIDAFSQIIETGEAQEIAYLSRGVAYFQTGDHDNAIKDFSKVLELNSNSARAYYYRGITHLKKEEFKEAIADLDRSIDLRPDHSTAFFARGVAHAQLGNDDEATRNIKSALMDSETSLQGFSDNYGMFRTQFNKALSIMTGEQEPPTIKLTDEEKAKLMKWLQETEEKDK
jgi:tetratricopeptide (TPR) repeat protein